MRGLTRFIAVFAFLVIFSIAVSPAVYAASSVKITTSDSTIDNSSDSAYFDLVFTGENARTVFDVELSGDYSSFYWNVSSNVSDVFNNGLVVSPSSSETVRFYVSPLQNTVVREGISYEIPLSVSSRSGFSDEVVLYVSFASDPVGFYFDENSLISLPVPVTSDNFEVKVNLNSKVSSSFDNVSINLSHSRFEDVKEVSIDSKGSESLTFNVPTKGLSRGNNLLTFNFVVDGKELLPFYKSFNLGGVGFSEEFSGPNHFLLKSESKATFTNYGSSMESSSFEIPVETNSFVKAFSFYSDDYVVSEDGRFLVWEFIVPPGDVVEISYGTNYRIFVYIGIVFSALIFVYFFFRSSVGVKKSVFIVKRSSNSYSLKVVVVIKNRSSKSLNGVSFVERLPSFVSLNRTLGSELNVPSSVSRTKSGSSLKWSLGVMSGREERIITYFVTSNISVVGSLRLPPGKILFSDDSGHKFVASSNSVKVRF